MNIYVSDYDNGSDSQPITTVIGGSTYVRWGRTTCGNNSQLLYEGQVMLIINYIYIFFLFK